MTIIGAFALASMVSACFGFCICAMMGNSKEYDSETENMFRKMSEERPAAKIIPLHGNSMALNRETL